MSIQKGENLSKMILLATQRHAGQFDKAGEPYILHPLAVMYLLNTDDEELRQMAVGHDLIEDTPTTYSELREMGFSERVICGIMCGTKVPGETPEEYKQKVMSNVDTVRWKMKDLEHNSDIRRHKGVTPKDIERTIGYHKFYLDLKKVLPEYR